MSRFDFSSSVILEDNFVLLRPLELSDFENLLEYSLNEPETWKYSALNAAGRENLENYLKMALEARETKKEYPFIVFDKTRQKYAGSTRFYDIHLSSRALQLGYTWYGKVFRGTGLNKHCKFLLLDFAFNSMDMERVEFRADNKNGRSIAAMKSIGCTVEGVLRSSGPTPDGNRRDSIVLSILKQEWNNSLKTKLFEKLV
jgi:RimJ/RimL family protein N-acetyltransferase